MHYYTFNIGDYRRDTAHLSLLEHGIYRQLIDSYYLSERPLPLDEIVLMRSHSIRTADEKQALKNVLSDFFISQDDGWHHVGCEKIITKYREKSAKASRSARVRWDENANALRTQSERYANHKPITNNQKPIENKKTIQPTKVVCPSGVSEDLWSDWLALRNKKKLPVTTTALKGMQREAEKAKLPLTEVLRICCERGWGGFKYEWVQDELRSSQAAPNKRWWEDIHATQNKAKELNIKWEQGTTFGQLVERLRAITGE